MDQYLTIYGGKTTMRTKVGGLKACLHAADIIPADSTDMVISFVSPTEKF